MRIGMFTDQYYPQVSGVVTSITMLYDGLTAMGHEVFIFTSYDDKKYPDVPELEGKNIINIKGISYPWKVVKDYKWTLTKKKYAKLIKEYNLDIMHVHTEFNMMKIAIKAAKILKIPVIHTFHTNWKEYLSNLFPIINKIFPRILLRIGSAIVIKPIYYHSDFEIYPTKKIISVLPCYYLRKKAIDQKPYEIIPTGLELYRFDKNRFKKDDILKIKEKYNLAQDEFIYTYIGRTSPEKNIPLIIKAFSKAFSTNSKVKLLIVGGGAELKELQDEAKKTECSDRIIFTGQISQSEVPLYYQVSDVFLNASKTETQGLTYIEALSSSVPIVCQKDECLDGVLIDRKNGLFFDGEEDFINKLIEIYNNKSLYNTLKENAKDSVKEYTKERYCENVLKAYQKTIKLYKEKQKN